MRFRVVVAVIGMLLVCNMMHAVFSGPVPKVNEQQLSKIPQWHCLRYFKHDLLMMRRCRHMYVPTAPRSANVK